jgi:hypothetical protein
MRPLKVKWTQERPTSLPAPSGVMTIWSPSRPPEAGRFPASEALGAATDAIVNSENLDRKSKNPSHNRKVHLFLFPTVESCIEIRANTLIY